MLDGCVFKQECFARKLRKSVRACACVCVHVCFMSSIAHLKYTCVDMRVSDNCYLFLSNLLYLLNKV